jgi:hypothetical protein
LDLNYKLAIEVSVKGGNKMTLLTPIIITGAVLALAWIVGNNEKANEQSK